MWWHSRRTLKDQTRDFLAALGDTSSEVASSLAAAGVTGTPGSAERCAVAAYLGAIIGSEDAISSVVVGTHRVYLRLHRGRRPVAVPLPRQIRDLIQAFDAELYPVLVRREPDSRLGAGGGHAEAAPVDDREHEVPGLH
jgi:hypothetical protein